MSQSAVRNFPAGAKPRAFLIEPAVVVVPLGLFIAVVAIAAPNGSYFPSSWGWAALAFLWAAAIGLVVRARVTLSALETAYLGSLSLLLAWTAASLLWSPTATQTMYEIERTVVYVAFAFALAILGRRSVPLLLPALLAGIVAVAAYALATRLFPDRVGSFDSYVGYRLSEPLGYWNALSAFAAVGAAVAVGLAARAQSVVLRALSAASLVLLLPVILFTFGRGAWIALAVGLAVAIAVDPRQREVRSVGLDDRLEPLHRPGGLDSVRARSDVEPVLRFRKAELVDEDLGELRVVVLTRMDDDVLGIGKPSFQLRDDGRHLHEVRSRTDDVEQSLPGHVPLKLDDLSC